MAALDIWQLTHVQEVNGNRITNVHYYRQDDSDGAANPRVDLATAFDGSVADKMQTKLSNQWESLCYEIKKVGVTGQQFWRQLSTQGIGAIVLESLNAATVCVIAQFAAGGSHRDTGRINISGLPITYEKRNNLSLAGGLAMDIIGDETVLQIANGGVQFTPGRAPDGVIPFAPWILSDMRIPLSKLRPRRQSTKC